MSNDNKPNIAGAMLQLFKQELNSHCNVLEEILDEKGKSIAPAQCEKFLKACRSINGTAKLVEMGFLVDLSQMFENVFSDYLRTEIELNKQFFVLFSEGIKLLQSLANIEADFLDAWMENNCNKARDITLDLAALLNDNSNEQPAEQNDTKITTKEVKTPKKNVAVKTKTRKEKTANKKSKEDEQTKKKRQAQLAKDIIDETIIDLNQSKRNKQQQKKKALSKKRASTRKHAVNDKSAKDKVLKVKPVKTRPDKDKPGKPVSTIQATEPKLEARAQPTLSPEIKPATTESTPTPVHNPEANNDIKIASINRQIDPMMLELFQIETETNVNILFVCL